jgi:3-oxoacyl-[acyl-carrier protein] reductase
LLIFIKLCDHKRLKMTDSLWKNQVALVSGAGSDSGIGLAIARRLAREGVRVLLSASSARIQQRVAELQSEGIDARGMSADLTDETQVAALSEWAHAQFGRIDILVNNAGMAMQGSPEPFAEVASMDLLTWNLSLARNLLPAHPRRAAGHAGARLRPHRQHQLDHRHPR